MNSNPPKASTDLHVLPKKNAEYGTREYWQQRYAQEEGSFDWFKTYADLKPLLHQHVPRDARIVMLGCGNSTLSGDMYEDGFRRIVNVDYSDVVIAQMRQRYQGMSDMAWEVMDVRELALSDGSVDVALDKGTLDALMCEQGDVWEPSPELCENIRRVVDEVDRVLAPGGKFIWITFGQPHFRRRHLERAGWSVAVERLNDGGFDYFAYIASKSQTREG
ncbi:hypothetical protein LPJ55_004013 [Coemansia sp. RSA 990]|nr:hypothetical protein LPJ68_000290 [Coemansia sp. RSA 1086]KAJ1871274.1 hypothetical protein LPJ55_004013 [Coemansia sp. RSA 990]KAJ2676148.1 hypothetical protein IWW42_000817 [Coemansia sp. RSA 1085]